MPRPLRVVLHTDSPGRGGAEISLGNLLAALDAGDARPVEPHVLGVDPEVTRWIAARRRGTPWSLVPRGVRGTAAVAAALARLRPDILHANLSVPWACAPGLTAALATPGLRVVAVQQLPLRTTRLDEWLRTRGLLVRLDAHVAVGEASGRRVEDFYALGRHSVLSVPNGVPDVPLPAPAPRPPGAPLRVVSAARLDPVKGADVLLRALPRVPGVEVTLLGEGGWRSHLEALAAELGVADRVAMPGWSDHARQALVQYDVVVLPSRSEGFPLSIAEAMLAARPVVATPIGSVTELVTDGGTGLLVPVGDDAALAVALARLRDDRHLARRLGERGREVAVERHTDTVMAARHRAVWEEVLARPRAPRVRVPQPRP
jgi:glycosyltransferase involved in cell wall biosynthesis